MKVLADEFPNDLIDVLNDVAKDHLGREAQQRLRTAHAEFRPILQRSGCAFVSVDYSCLAFGEVGRPSFRDADGRSIESAPVPDDDMVCFFLDLFQVLFPDWDANGADGTFTWHLDTDTVKVTHIIRMPEEIFGTWMIEE